MKKKMRILLGDDYNRFMLIVAVFFAFLSAFAVCAFFHMRHNPNVEAYYFDKSLSMGRDIFSTREYMYFFILVPIFAALYRSCLIDRMEFSMGALLCAGVVMVNVLAALSMENSGLTATLLPMRAVGTDMLLHIAACVGFAAIAFSLLHVLYKGLYRINWNLAGNIRSKHVGFLSFLLAFVLIVLCWLPGLLACWPGSLPAETLTQIRMFQGVQTVDASFPVLTTVFYGALYTLGQKMGGDLTGVLLCSVIQSVLFAAVLAMTACRIRKYTKSDKFYLACILLYGICPIWEIAAQAPTRDLLHTACFILFLLQYLACMREKKIKMQSVLWMGVTAALAAFTRKGAFWLVLLSMLVLIIRQWKAYWLRYGLATLAVVALYVSAHQFLYPALGFEPARKVENLSLPLQQMAMYCHKNAERIPDEEKEIVNTALDFDTIVAEYTPLISDPVKNTYHGDSHLEFWKLYVDSFIKKPFTFIKATVMHVFEYGNPWFQGNDAELTELANDENLHLDHSNSVLFERMTSYWQSWHTIPGLRALSNTGVYTWILLAMAAYALHRRAMAGFWGTLPVLLVYAGFLFTHVNGEIRYAYPLIASVPLLIGYIVYCVSRKISEDKLIDRGEDAGQHGKSLQWLKTFEEPRGGSN